MNEKLLNHAAVKRFIRQLVRRPTSEHLEALEARVREILVKQAATLSENARMRRDLFIGVPASPGKR